MLCAFWPSEVGLKAKLQMGMRGTMRGDRFGTPLVIVCCNISFWVNVQWRCWFPFWQKLTITLKDVLLIIGIIRATVKLGTMATMVGGKKMGFDLKLTEVKTWLNCWIYYQTASCELHLCYSSTKVPPLWNVRCFVRILACPEATQWNSRTATERRDTSRPVLQLHDWAASKKI